MSPIVVTVNYFSRVQFVQSAIVMQAYCHSLLANFTGKKIQWLLQLIGPRFLICEIHCATANFVHIVVVFRIS